MAPGFYQAAHKLFVVVELLMGDIPDRSTFRHPVLEQALGAYFEVVKGMFCWPPHFIGKMLMTRGIKLYGMEVSPSSRLHCRNTQQNLKPTRHTP